MGTISHLVRAKIIKEQILFHGNALSFFKNQNLRLHRIDSFALVSVAGLHLQSARYSEIVWTAKQLGYALCDLSKALVVATSVSTFPVVRIGMMPRYSDGKAHILCIFSNGKRSIIDVETFKPLHQFSPFTVFAFSK